MSLPHYNEVYDNFDAAALEAEILDGRLDSGLNVCHEICDKWASDPQKVALFYEKVGGGDGVLTFAELKAASARFANYLKSHGVKKGDRVAGLLAGLDVRNELRRFDVLSSRRQQTFLAEARLYDLFVSTLPQEDDHETMALVESVLFGAGHSVLLVPPARPPRWASLVFRRPPRCRRRRQGSPRMRATRSGRAWKRSIVRAPIRR